LAEIAKPDFLQATKAAARGGRQSAGKLRKFLVASQPRPLPDGQLNESLHLDANLPMTSSDGGANGKSKSHLLLLLPLAAILSLKPAPNRCPWR
jgi:hypothetical protein